MAFNEDLPTDLYEDLTVSEDEENEMKRNIYHKRRDAFEAYMKEKVDELVKLYHIGNMSACDFTFEMQNIRLTFDRSCDILDKLLFNNPFDETDDSEDGILISLPLEMMDMDARN